jgi:hypothetical protein
VAKGSLCLLKLAFLWRWCEDEPKAGLRNGFDSSFRLLHSIFA